MASISTFKKGSKFEDRRKKKFFREFFVKQIKNLETENAEDINLKIIIAKTEVVSPFWSASPRHR